MSNNFRRLQRPPKTWELVNDNIHFCSLIVIDQTGKNLGQMTKTDALALANASGLDLFVISDKTKIPVAKILDYGKYLYDKKRKVKLAKKNHSVIKVKSIKVKTQISNHDLEWKSQQAIAWLKDGFRVHFVIKAYGRISTKIDLIQDTFQRFIMLVGSYGATQGPLKKTNPTLYEAFFNPVKGVVSPIVVKEGQIDEK